MYRFRTVDVFAGAGGMSTGLKASGAFEIAAAVELDQDAADTLERNHPGTAVLRDSVCELDGSRICQLAGGPVDVLVGGPPCQGFSIHGPRDPSHPSTELLYEFARLVEELQPVGFLIENVPGLLSFRRGFVVDELVRRLNRIEVNGARYSVVLETLDAAAFGVPQHRKRVFIVGILGESFHFPRAGSGRITINEAIADLPEWTAEPGVALELPPSQPLTAYQRARRGRSKKLNNHSAKRLQDLRQRRIALLEEGQDRRALPDELQAGGRAGKYRRLRGSAPSPTITAHMAHDTSDFIHPHYNRMLTVREAARLQSFDDRFVFAGSQYQQFRQVGNAVPPLLARALGEALDMPLRRALRGCYAARLDSSRRRTASA